MFKFFLASVACPEVFCLLFKKRDQHMLEGVFKSHYRQTSKGKGMEETNCLSLGFPEISAEIVCQLTPARVARAPVYLETQ